MATDLTAVSLRGVNGQPIVAIAESTLQAGGSMVDTWRRLEPMVRTLTDRVASGLEDDALNPKEAAQLLQLCANVVHKVGSASVGMLKAADGLSKLSLLLSVGKTTRRSPAEMSQSQLASLLVETLKKLGDAGPCPLFHASKAIPLPE
jgi:hypothetical protein